jgi:hypothetical protein
LRWRKLNCKKGSTIVEMGDNVNRAFQLLKELKLDRFTEEGVNDEHGRQNDPPTIQMRKKSDQDHTRADTIDKSKRDKRSLLTTHSCSCITRIVMIFYAF